MLQNTAAVHVQNHSLVTLLRYITLCYAMNSLTSALGLGRISGAGMTERFVYRRLETNLPQLPF